MSKEADRILNMCTDSRFMGYSFCSEAEQMALNVNELEAEIQALKLEYEPETLTEGDFIEYEAHQVNVSLCSKEELKQAKLEVLEEIVEAFDNGIMRLDDIILMLKQQIEDE